MRPRRPRASGSSQSVEPLERRTLFVAAVLNEVTTDFGDSEFADDVETLRDDRVVVLGHTETADPAMNRLFLARYDIDGSLDRTFGEDGRIFGEFPNFQRATSLAIDRSGRILVAGVTSDPDPAVALVRFTSSGFLDTSFGNGGIGTIQVGTGEVVNDMAVDNSGRAVVVGQTLQTFGGSVTPVPVWMVARFEVFGTPDSTFGGFETAFDGAVAFPVGIGESGATSVALDGDQRILVGGFSTEQSAGEPPEKRFAVARLGKTGELDEDFGPGGGDDGIVTVDFGLPTVVQDIDIAKGSKIVAAGNTLGDVNAPGEQIFVARLDRGGNLDASFGGGDGFTLSTFGGAHSQIAREIVVDNKDRVLLGGEIDDAGEPTGDLNDDGFLIARYNPDGTPDTTFAPDGGLINEVRGGFDSVEMVAGLTLQREGKNGSAVLAGNTASTGPATPADQDLAVVRYATDATTQTGSAKLNGSKLVVKGTNRADVITVSPNVAAGTIEVNVNGAVTSFPGAAVARIEVGAKDGDDEASSSLGSEVVSVLLGGNGDDDLRLLGDAKGRLEGGDDDDDITGGIHGDRLKGGSGDDILFGGDGPDDIEGDRGFDRLFGEDGNDDLKASDGFTDDVDGGSGDDDAIIDFFDFVTRVDDIDFE